MQPGKTGRAAVRMTAAQQSKFDTLCAVIDTSLRAERQQWEVQGLALNELKNTGLYQIEDGGRWADDWHGFVLHRFGIDRVTARRRMGGAGVMADLNNGQNKSTTPPRGGVVDSPTPKLTERQAAALAPLPTAEARRAVLAAAQHQVHKDIVEGKRRPGAQASAELLRELAEDRIDESLPPAEYAARVGAAEKRLKDHDARLDERDRLKDAGKMLAKARKMQRKLAGWEWAEEAEAAAKLARLLECRLG